MLQLVVAYNTGSVRNTDPKIFNASEIRILGHLCHRYSLENGSHCRDLKF